MTFCSVARITYKYEQTFLPSALSHPGRFTPLERIPLRIEEEIGGPQKRSGRFGVENGFLFLPGIETCSASSLI